jgi:hypothetical protein
LELLPRPLLNHGFDFKFWIKILKYNFPKPAKVLGCFNPQICGIILLYIGSKTENPDVCQH